MTLVNARAAFEKAVKDAVVAADGTVTMVFDNVPYITPGKTKKYVVMSVNFGRATVQSQGAASDYYAGFIQCSIYVPKNKGTSILSAIGESVIDGLTSINASNYTDTFSCKPRAGEIVGPGVVESEDESHYLGVITCQFSANA
jgi:hypothetical protein